MTIQLQTYKETFKVGLEGRVKHGYLLQWLRDNDKNQADLAKRVGIPPSLMSNIISMKQIPNISIQERLSIVTKIEIEDLFPEKYISYVKYTKGMPKRKLQVVKDIPIEDLEILSISQPKLPDVYIEGIENANIIQDLLNKLPYREGEMLKLYYGVNKNKALSYKQIGVMFGISGCRTGQVIKNTLDKLETQFRDIYGENADDLFSNIESI